jgi:hypothetical protein
MSTMQETVETLVTEAGRMISTPGHIAARTYLVEQLGTTDGVEPSGESFVLAYGDQNMGLANIIARIPGPNPEREPVVLGAHYDTCGPLPGADDNAAAVAILLELAPRIFAAQLERPVVLAFFDGEEPPCFLTENMGSTHWYTHQREEAVHCAVVLDLMGHDVAIPGLEDLVFVTGMETDPGLAVVLANAKEVEGVRLIPTLNRYIGDMSDHHAFRADERPYLFFSCGRWAHYHAPTDTPEKLNYEKMAAFADFLLQILPSLCAQGLSGPFEGYDSAPTERRFMNKSLGPVLESMGMQVNTREDLTTVVRTLMGMFGLKP